MSRLLVCLSLTAFVACPLLAQEATSLTLPGLSTSPSESKSASPADDDDNVAVRKALNKRITLRFENVELKEAVQQLSAQLGVTVMLDVEGMDEAGVTSDQLVSITVPNAKVRNALHLLLEPLHMTFSVRHGVLLLTSQERAAEFLETRVYNVHDLVEVRRGGGGGVAGFPVPKGMKVLLRGSDPTMPLEDFDTLIDLITSTVQPDSWTDNGGSGSISGFPRGLLVISQTEDIHEEVQSLLDRMRAAFDRVGATLPAR